MLMTTRPSDAAPPLRHGEARGFLGVAQGSRGDGPLRRALLLAWLLLAAWLASRHVLWRDEVRALTMALSGDSTWAMVRNVHGEGHPALWYLLLRCAHGLTGMKQALPGLAFAIGAGAAALFALRAPFRPAVIALVLFGAFCLNEYTVVARNYGLSMLLMFAFAWAYPRWKGRGAGLGVLLALLCNSNVPSVLLAGGLGLFWAAELLARDGPRWTPGWRAWARAMGLMLLGVAACAAEVYPPYNDAAVSPMAGRLSPGAVLLAAVNFATPLGSLLPEAWWDWRLSTLVLTAMVVGGVLGLIRSPGGLVAALAVAVALPLFFQILYPGGYRHQALFIAFLLTLYWLAAQGGGGRWRGAPQLGPATQALLERCGQGAFAALLAVQVIMGGAVVGAAARGVPDSRAQDLAALLRRERLERAVVIANPDVLLEPLPYYAGNPTWLTRERKWGNVAAFTKAAKADVALGDLLATARRLRARTHRPVVTAIQVQLDPAAPAQRREQGYVGALTTTPAEVRAFLAATQRLARFGPALTDESYDVYLLTRP